MQNKITIIGCGPGGKAYMTFQAADAIENAQIIAGSTRLLETYAPDMTARAYLDGNYKDGLDEIAPHFENGRRIAVLVSGDVGICSLAKLVVTRFGIENCYLIPGISSVQVAFARLGQSWKDARLLSAHGRNLDVEVDQLRQNPAIAILCGTSNDWPEVWAICDALRSTHRVYLCDNLTLDTETIQEVSHDDADPKLPPDTLRVVVMTQF